MHLARTAIGWRIEMTVVPGVDSNTMKLICDHCGAVTIGSSRGIRDMDVVWPLTTEHGWAGSPFAAGPHQCPACDASRIVLHRDLDRSTAAAHGDRSLRITHHSGTAVVEFGGEVDLLGVELLRQALTAVGAVGRAIVLDLSDAGSIDSTGLSGLVRAHRDLKQRGTTLCLAAPPRTVLTVLHTMRLDVLFRTFDDREQALRHIASDAENAQPGQGGGSPTGGMARSASIPGPSTPLLSSGRSAPSRTPAGASRLPSPSSVEERASGRRQRREASSVGAASGSSVPRGHVGDGAHAGGGPRRPARQ